jgi:hypothetical protein
MYTARQHPEADAGGISAPVSPVRHHNKEITAAMPTLASPFSHGRSRSWASGTLLALLALLFGSWLLPSVASARSVSFASMFSPVSRLGEGTSYTTELTLSGSEYHGHVDPLTGLTVHLPAGVGVSSAGFPTCSKFTLEQFTPAGCPAGSLAGPVGSLKLVLYFGTEAIEEEATVQAVFGPAGVLYFFVEGGPPVQIEIIMEGHYVSDSSPYGQDLVLTVPTIETVPGAPDASITALTLNVGASREESGVVFNSVSVPSTCPSGKFAWAGDAAFNGEASEPIGATETACPAAGSRQATTTTLSVSNATPLRGETVTYTATVTPNSSGGPALSGGVTFFDNGSPIAGCSARPLTQAGVSATATCQTSYAAYGAHTVGATYGGDSNYLGSDSGTENVVLTAEAEEAHKHQEEAANKPPASSGTTGSSTPSGSGSNTPVVTISSAQIAASLARQLVPSGKAAKIAALLKAGGLTMSFTALEAGRLSLQWYELQSGAKIAKKAKPVLVASGQVSFSGAGVEKVKVRLTAAGKKLLRHGKTVKVEAKGVFVSVAGMVVTASRSVLVKR